MPNLARQLSGGNDPGPTGRPRLHLFGRDDWLPAAIPIGDSVTHRSVIMDTIATAPVSAFASPTVGLTMTQGPRGAS
jgi:hypothetical protein